ncbi:FAD/NAD(P)-binding domain-containing protein [Lentithecium fluviatile CBS 122367]|uniref:FAD/NAD(P)-binding domain-containing protein n=1 Tax=Lentithecium fluviatile CBS 122367 TaxID=1168545 RepID=A0A6G1J3Z7_9PLEO|nr:FAD/NAD(P)-binding domain-containing protein [Lentithecium fluviatile CBS 122367]
MKSVLVVGAGPAGLVAAKTLLQHNSGKTFSVTVFEAADRVGGMWRASPDETGDKCSPHMETNLSRFTVTFPDLAWPSVDLTKPRPLRKSEKVCKGQPHQTFVLGQWCPPFPRAWEVGRYLETYTKKFIPAGIVQTNRRVVAADLINELTQPQIWRVTSIDENTQEQFQDRFDLLIVASGFFDRPAESIQPSQGLSPSAEARIQHSSKFRDVASFGNKAGKVLVYGGGISGVEAAATAAFQISNARHGPVKPYPVRELHWSKSVVYHVFDRPFLTLPRFLPVDPCVSDTTTVNEAPNFQPLDIVLYNLAHKGDGPISASNGPVTSERATQTHKHLRFMTAGGQDKRHGALLYKDEDQRYPPFVSITDTYDEFVRSGLIVPVRGRVENIVHEPAQDMFSVDVASSGHWAFAEQESKIKNVVGIVQATGFQVHLDWLSNDVKQALSYDPTCRRMPFLLSRGSMFNPNVPNIAFIGFYEGPFWGVMDMQSRVVAHTWDLDPDGETDAKIYDMSESASIREAIKNKALDISQFWMADHVGLVEELSRIVGIERDDFVFKGQEGPYLSARYRSPGPNEEALLIISEVKQNLEFKPWWLPHAVFRGLQGQWIFRRTSTQGEGWRSEGTAEFHPRAPKSFDIVEYLYREENTIASGNGNTVSLPKRLIYGYDGQWFTVWKAQNDGSHDEILHRLSFQGPIGGESGWHAHDDYDHNNIYFTTETHFEFRFSGASLFTYRVSQDYKPLHDEAWRDDYFSPFTIETRFFRLDALENPDGAG